MIRKFKKLLWNKKPDVTVKDVADDKRIEVIEVYHFENSPLVRHAIARFRDKKIPNI